MIIRNKKRLIVGIGLMMMVMFLNFPSPLPPVRSFEAGNASLMNIPIKDMDGYKFGGLVLFAVLVVGIYLFGTSLENIEASTGDFWQFYSTSYCLHS